MSERHPGGPAKEGNEAHAERGGGGDREDEVVEVAVSCGDEGLERVEVGKISQRGRRRSSLTMREVESRAPER